MHRVVALGASIKVGCPEQRNCKAILTHTRLFEQFEVGPVGPDSWVGFVEFGETPLTIIDGPKHRI